VIRRMYGISQLMYRMASLMFLYFRCNTFEVQKKKTRLRHETQLLQTHIHKQKNKAVLSVQNPEYRFVQNTTLLVYKLIVFFF
jgi:hypothetical protein